jgi:hypothetical protein
MSIDNELESSNNPASAEAPAVVLPVLPEVAPAAPAAAPAKKAPARR